MPALSALETRILFKLEEADGKDVATVLNALTHPTGAASELANIQHALENLVRIDLVRMSMTRDASGRLMHLSKPESLEAIEDLWSGLRFKAGRWTDTRHSAPLSGDPFPYIVKTKAG